MELMTKYGIDTADVVKAAIVTTKY